MTDKLINLAEDDTELVAIFFHELGHLKHKHITRQSLQDAMFTIALFFVIGDVDAVEIVGAVPALIAHLEYSRDFEREADIYALEQMDSRQIDLDYLRQIMQRLSGESAVGLNDAEGHVDSKQTAEETVKPKDSGIFGIPNFLSTHPGWDERLELVETFKQNKS